MTFRLTHDWPRTPTRILAAELSVCPHCGTLRVIEDGRPTTYLRPGVAEQRDRLLEEPPCIEQPRRPTYRARTRDRIGCALGPEARARAFRDMLDRERKPE
ncbi:MAG: hypothetical protein EBS48_05185 [Actinobacteria bacterium]|nr:hypothetical protein [Actinomycetota bacterium]